MMNLDHLLITKKRHLSIVVTTGVEAVDGHVLFGRQTAEDLIAVISAWGERALPGRHHDKMLLHPPEIMPRRSRRNRWHRGRLPLMIDVTPQRGHIQYLQDERYTERKVQGRNCSPPLPDASKSCLSNG